MTKKTDSQEQTEKTIANVNELCKIFSTYERKLVPAIEAAGLQPEYETAFGRKTMRLFSVEKVRGIVEAMRAEDAKKAEARAAAKSQAATEQAPPVDLNPVLLAISGVHDRVDTLEEIAKKTAEQNVLIFRALDSMKADLFNRLDAIQSAIDSAVAHQQTLATTTPALPDAANQANDAPSNLQTVPEAAALDRAKALPAVKKPRVVVIGLLNAQRALIEKEYNSVFDLEFFSSQEGRGKAFSSSAANAAAVMAMIGFIDHGVDNVMKAAGTRYTPVRGGLTALRDALTTLYVTQEEKRVA